MEEEYVDFTKLLRLIDKMEKLKVERRSFDFLSESQARKSKLLKEVSKQIYEAAREKLERKLKEKILLEKSSLVERIIESKFKDLNL